VRTSPGFDSPALREGRERGERERERERERSVIPKVSYRPLGGDDVSIGSAIVTHITLWQGILIVGQVVCVGGGYMGTHCTFIWVFHNSATVLSLFEF
jgi:hypothetical protein